MAKGKFSGQFSGDKHIIEVGLEVLTWEEDGVHFVYAPSLDLTGYDNTKEGAKLSFENTLKDTLVYMERKKSLFDELERLGWTVNRKKKRVNSPDLEELMKDNSEIESILNRPDVMKESHNVELVA